MNKDNENASADKVTSSADKMPISADEVPINTLSEQQKKVLHFAKENGQITSHQVELLLEVKQRRARSILGKLVDMGVLERLGAYRNTVYTLKNGRKK